MRMSPFLEDCMGRECDVAGVLRPGECLRASSAFSLLRPPLHAAMENEEALRGRKCFKAKGEEVGVLSQIG
jgi:hypothetical protein